MWQILQNRMSYILKERYTNTDILRNSQILVVFLIYQFEFVPVHLFEIYSIRSNAWVPLKNTPRQFSAIYISLIICLSYIIRTCTASVTDTVCLHRTLHFNRFYTNKQFNTIFIFSYQGGGPNLRRESKLLSSDSLPSNKNKILFDFLFYFRLPLLLLSYSPAWSVFL